MARTCSILCTCRNARRHAHTHKPHSLCLVVHSLMGIQGVSLSPVVSNAAVSMRAHVSLQVSAFVCFRGTFRSGLAGSYGGSVFNFFEGPPYCFASWLHQFTFPRTVHKGSLLSTSSVDFASQCGDCREFVAISHTSVYSHFTHCPLKSFAAGLFKPGALTWLSA